MKTKTQKEWCVRFIGDYFSLVTNVTAKNKIQAEAAATTQLIDQHGLNMRTAGVFDIEVFDAENGDNQ
jgi:hypothetical protein